MSYFPEFTFSVGPLGNFTVKRFDLTSDIHEARVAASSTTVLDHVIDSIVGGEPMLEPIESQPPVCDKPPVSIEKTDSQVAALLKAMDENPDYKPSILFEDYSSSRALKNLVSKLTRLKQSPHSLRIAFLGDSFIEADILTADVRDLLQSVYGGSGVGFVPMASPAPKSRSSVECVSDGWESFSMINYKSADWKRLTLNGFYYVPSEGASVSVALPKRNAQPVTCQHARLLFVNEKNATLSVSINGLPPTTHTPPPATTLQTLDFTGDIHSVSFTVANVSGFYGYGVILDNNTGIYVDNYSVRGSSGILLSTADKALSRDFGKILPPDVIVLQYGLNVASAQITNYDYYKVKMIEVVNRLSDCFPDATFVIMGVGDRVVKNGTSLESMPTIPAMVAVQREIARKTRSLFWDTFAVMGGKNSMVAYVSHNPPLASKDYTHINHAGGKRIAQAFVFSILKEVEAAYLADTIVHDQPLADTLTPAPQAAQPVDTLTHNHEIIHPADTLFSTD